MEHTPLILVVDDEPLVLYYLVLLLEDAGYKVIEARSGAEAIDLLASNYPDLLITDNQMPGMSGDSLVIEAKRRIPDLPVLRLTGGGVGEEPADSTLYKPFQPEELLTAVQRILSA